jgi:acetoin utilization protein AcuC
MTAPLVVWDPRMLGYDLGGDHPLHPLRWELTWALAGDLGILDAYQVLTPDAADDETLGTIHTPAYIAAVREASEEFPGRVGHGLGTPDNPMFPGMHENSALIAGGSVQAAQAIARGDVDRAVNFCGGLHHAMADYASGFCVYNDAALAIRALPPGSVAESGLYLLGTDALGRDLLSRLIYGARVSLLVIRSRIFTAT